MSWIHPDWIKPQWPVPAHVHALCTTRSGGHSLPPYQALNLGDHVGDSHAAVTVNRVALQEAMGAEPVFLSQVHGVKVLRLSAAIEQGMQADASVTQSSRIACTMMVADCLPVLFTNMEGSTVAAAHAGWRSLAGTGGHGVIEGVLEEFRALALNPDASVASKIIAWLGPCIGPDKFEVGADVRDAFVSQDLAASDLFIAQEGGKWMADLQGLARLRLAQWGVTQIYGNDGSHAWCTVSNPSRFFSYRRDGVSGRMAACVWLD
jgi:polyphenol oxidase